MNSITKKTLLVSLALLLNACAHHPQQHSYYPDTGSYGSGYTVMQRNYYGGTSGHYDNGYDWDRGNFPHQHHDQYNAPPRRDNDYPRPRYQHDIPRYQHEVPRYQHDIPRYQPDVRERHGNRPHDNRRDNNWGGHNFNHRADNENNHQPGNPGNSNHHQHGNPGDDNHHRRDHR